MGTEQQKMSGVLHALVTQRVQPPSGAGVDVTERLEFDPVYVKHLGSGGSPFLREAAGPSRV
ncbi:MAG: hypothetical protein OXB99_07815, partial [Acidimicrobiaceae bacterium]|nr:hypothetical protein [Acidimicrobiaceae bacterium]